MIRLVPIRILAILLMLIQVGQSQVSGKERQVLEKEKQIHRLKDFPFPLEGHWKWYSNWIFLNKQQRPTNK